MRQAILYCIFYLLFTSNSFGQAFAKNCAPPSSYFYNPALKKSLAHLSVQNNQAGYNAFNRSVVKIPVVVHVVWRTVEENISDEQILSQVAALNRDFQLSNEDVAIIPAVFKNRIGNTGFEFCLANIDENGQPTTGITRTETKYENIGALTGNPRVYYTDRGGQDAWDTQHYVNIWVADTPEESFIGYGSRPGERSAAEDGIIIHPRCFGTMGTAKAPFNLGRTATHELGHYFNLHHLDGDNNICEMDDEVADTPKQVRKYFGCPTDNPTSCGSLDMVANYMNNVDDACMAMFTRGQVQRMQIALFEARGTLLASVATCKETTPKENVQLTVCPSPARGFLYVVATDSKETTIPYRIIDTKGAIIQEGIVEGNKTNFVPVPLITGLFWMQFLMEEEFVVKKLLLF